MKKIILLLFLAVFGFGYANAQIEREEILISKIIYDIPEWGKPIRYYFPLKVDSLIDALCKMRNSSCFVRIDNILEQDTVEILVYEWKGIVAINSDTGSIERLIASSNRYWRFNDNTAPILFATDFIYTFNNTVISHAIGGFKYTGRYPEKGLIFEGWYN